MSFEPLNGRPPRRPLIDKPQSFGNGLVAWFIFCAAMAVGWIGFLVWAIYELVTWVTSK